MPRYWGIHSGIPFDHETRHMLGKALDYWVPVDDRMRAGDYVYLFRFDEYLYGYGSIMSLEKPTLRPDGAYRQISVHWMCIGGERFDVKTEILWSGAFHNYDRIKVQNLSSFDDEQVRHLNSLYRRTGPSPPDPLDPQADDDPALPRLRPVLADFILEERLQMDETRFDEFKTVSSQKVVDRILGEVDEYVIGFLNLEDRRGVDHCRIFWGVTDKRRVVEGVKLTDKERDKLRCDVAGKLAGIKPSIASSAYYVEIHQVHDAGGAAIPDLYVVEVGVAQGEPGEFYCSQGGHFYIKEDGRNPELKGQSLIAEIKRRFKGELMRVIRDSRS